MYQSIPKLPGSDNINVEEICEKDIVFVDFMRDDEYDEDGVLIAEAPKVKLLALQFNTLDWLLSQQLSSLYLCL